MTVRAGGPLLSVRGLRISSHLAGRARTLVSGVDLEVHEGEAVGIVGESGSGKSLTARALIGLPPPGITVDGGLTYRGRTLEGARERELAALRGAEIALVLQDPFTMLNPLRRCGRHIDETLRDHRGRRLSRAQRRDEAVRRLAEVGIDDPSVVDRYPFELSGGMRQRVAIAAALARGPRLLIADEPSTALDTIVQQEILELLARLRRERGMAMVLITHDLRVAFSMCDRVYVMYAGRILETAPGTDLEREPLHPYSLGLLLSEPPIDRRLERLVGMEGTVPAADDVAGSCAFAPRCRWALPACCESSPVLAPVAPDRWSACLRADELRDAMSHERAAAARRADAVACRSESTALVSVTGVEKVFERAGRRTAALRGVDLEIRAQESVGLVGGSGSGKTTLARCLLGLSTPTAGTIEIDGIDATDYTRLSSADRRRVRGTIQYIFQDPYSSLNPSRTIGATLAEALSVGKHRPAELTAEVATLLARVGLSPDYARRKPVALSGGERQRVAIARALAVKPKLIVCDEPVSALDVSVQAQVLDVLRELRDELGIAYLFITHDLAVVRQVVERLYVLHHGEVVEHGAADALLDDPSHPYTQRLLDAVPGSDGRALTGSGR